MIFFIISVLSIMPVKFSLPGPMAKIGTKRGEWLPVEKLRSQREYDSLGSMIVSPPVS